MQNDRNPGFGPIPSDRMWWGRKWGSAPVRRSQGDSFVGLVALITGIGMMDERTGRWCYPKHPNKLPGYILSAPRTAPARFGDRRQLSTTVNDIERSEMLHNSKVGHYWVVQAHYQHSEFDHFAAVAQIANAITRHYRVFVVAGIDKTIGEGGEIHMQYHFASNVRTIDVRGIGRKVRHIDAKPLWARERTWFSRMVSAVISQQNPIIPWEEEIYEPDQPQSTSNELKSVRRRAFRNNPWVFERVLKLPGLEPYLRQAFPDMPVIEDTYLLIGKPMAGELKQRLRGLGLRNRAEAYAHLLTLSGVEEYLRQSFREKKEADIVTRAYRIIDPTRLPASWEEKPRTVH